MGSRVILNCNRGHGIVAVLTSKIWRNFLAIQKTKYVTEWLPPSRSSRVLGILVRMSRVAIKLLGSIYPPPITLSKTWCMIEWTCNWWMQEPMKSYRTFRWAPLALWTGPNRPKVLNHRLCFLRFISTCWPDHATRRWASCSSASDTLEVERKNVTSSRKTWKWVLLYIAKKTGDFFWRGRRPKFL